MYTIAVDIGGTFTDVVAIDNRTGDMAMGKSLTTPADLQKGVMDGLANVAENLKMEMSDLLQNTERMVHATTQSSNAVFSFAGARTAVLTTRGFGDTLTIMRAAGRVAGLSVFERHHYRATAKPRLLVDERDIFEIPERIDAHGQVVTALDEAEVARVARLLADRRYEAVAVAYLFSHQNQSHEHRTAEIIRREAPRLYVSLSADIAPVMGEYERSATALFNAYVGPVIDNYLMRLERTLIETGLRQKLLIVQANGGLATVSQTVPIYTIESGPAAGVVGAAHMAERFGHQNVIATDVGGTTFKVAIIEGGTWSYNAQTILNQYQLRLPMIDVASIGAGGGSIAWVDSGRLRIGPQSASASPGPACYGLGGTEPTVTDADVALGYVDPNNFLGGRMKLHRDRALEAIRMRVAEPLFGGDVLAAAAGIRKVVDSQMADLIRKCTLERGYDPRDFVMMAYGGAGPVHASSYATEAGATKLLVPYLATVHSAYGAALSDIRFSLQFSEPIVLPNDPARIETIFADMEKKGAEALDRADVLKAKRRYDRWVEARYRRQVHQLRIPAPSRIDQPAVGQLISSFTQEYERLFGPGSGLSDAGVELINYGVDAVGVVDKAPWKEAPAGGAVKPLSTREAYCPVQRTMVATPIYDGPGLPPGSNIEGPAIIEHPGTTIVILSGQSAEIDAFRHTHIVTGNGRNGDHRAHR